MDRAETAITQSVRRSVSQTVLRANFFNDAIKSVRELFHPCRKQRAAARFIGKRCQVAVAEFGFHGESAFNAIGADAVDDCIIFLGDLERIRKVDVA